MRKYSTYILVAGLFIAASAIIYVIHYFTFYDPHHIFIFLISDLAFLPLEVYLVVIVIERILARREKQARMQKMNMVVGAFYSEIGSELIRHLQTYFRCDQEIRKQFTFDATWQHKDFENARAFARTIEEAPDFTPEKLIELRPILTNKRVFFVSLLQNPTLLENDSFTNLLWATFHLMEELDARESLDNLPDSDVYHIGGDIKRLYGHLVTQWIEYVEDMKTGYPYLFSFMSRNNPFIEKPPVIVS